MTDDGGAKPGWALVLGASAGTGAEIARCLARDPGYDVFGIHRGNFPEEAAELGRDVESTGRRALFHVANAGTYEGVQECADLLLRELGPRSIRFMVHSLSGASVGHFLPARGDAFHPKQFQKTFDHLAHSFAWWAQALHGRELLAPRARLLGLTNALHESILHNCGLIAAAKSALEKYVKYLAFELGPFGHRVNLLQFGTVVTPALRRVLGPEAMRRLEDVHREMIPAGRIGNVEEVARLVSVLARAETEWFNGATIDFMGGMTLRLFDLVLKPD